MITLLQKQFGFHRVEIKQLNGYDNKNYLLRTDRGNFIFKTYPGSSETVALIEAENETLSFLQGEKTTHFPQPVPFQDGSLCKTLEIDGQSTICRMLTFLEGQNFADVVVSDQLFQSLGVFLAQMNLKLQAYSNYTIQARQWEWGIQHLSLNRAFIHDIERPEDQKIVAYFFQQFEENVTPVFDQLRKSIIHNDANEWNILVKNDQISGLIDFGDLAYSPLINELAVAISYACFDKKNPLETAATILTAYHEVIAIEENEIAVLYYLIAARLCISVCNAAHSKKVDPENRYAFGSEKQAWALLYSWIRINPIKAESQFRLAIGLSAV